MSFRMEFAESSMRSKLLCIALEASVISSNCSFCSRTESTTVLEVFVGIPLVSWNDSHPIEVNMTIIAGIRLFIIHFHLD